MSPYWRTTGELRSLYCTLKLNKCLGVFLIWIIKYWNQNFQFISCYKYPSRSSFHHPQTITTWSLVMAWRQETTRRVPPPLHGSYDSVAEQQSHISIVILSWNYTMWNSYFLLDFCTNPTSIIRFQIWSACWSSFRLLCYQYQKVLGTLASMRTTYPPLGTLPQTGM